MSLGIVIKAPEGTVLAAESRVTLFAQMQSGGTLQQWPINFDNATKLLSFGKPNTSVGAVTYGQALIGQRTAHSFLPEFEQSFPQKRLTVKGFAEHLSKFYFSQWKDTMPEAYDGPDMIFIVGGYDEGAPYGEIYQIEIPRQPEPAQVMQNQFGINYGGQQEIVERIIAGYDNRLLGIAAQALGLSPEQVNVLKTAFAPLGLALPLQVLPLQDCVDLAIFAIRATIDAQKLSVGLRGCGGPIDVATITRSNGLVFIQTKQVHGETLTS